DLSATQTRLTPPNTCCCCAPTTTTTSDSAPASTTITTITSDDKRGVKRILEQLKDKVGIEKAVLDLKCKKIKYLEEYLSLE
ncbi:uncharacterized protein B0P05DRAFT_471695, partial [Gilbertella persicaria]|uniref:uncharacterized protein n=1 Tax=Gilbertella persicaria TaxID=101096 RepID=UPI0022200949